MIRNKRQKSGPVVIDLTGPAGNAYALLGLASQTAKQLGLDPAPILEGMQSGDYENLLQVFDSHFGNFFILER